MSYILLNFCQRNRRGRLPFITTTRVFVSVILEEDYRLLTRQMFFAKVILGEDCRLLTRQMFLSEYSSNKIGTYIRRQMFWRMFFHTKSRGMIGF